jgi:hypothetical protein
VYPKRLGQVFQTRCLTEPVSRGLLAKDSVAEQLHEIDWRMLVSRGPARQLAQLLGVVLCIESHFSQEMGG